MVADIDQLEALPIHVTFYGIIGATKGELEVSLLGLSEDDDDSGLSYDVSFMKKLVYSISEGVWLE